MKYVFLVASPITYLASLGVMCKEEIKDDDAVILSNWKGNVPFPIVPLGRRSWKDFFLNFSRFLNTPHYNDRFINKITGGSPYTLYVPMFGSSVSRFLLTNPCCKAFHFIEEGLNCYDDCVPFSLYNDKLLPIDRLRYSSWRERLLDIVKIIRGYSYKLGSVPFFHNSYFGMSGVFFYGFGERAYPGFPVDVVRHLSFADIKKRFDFEKKYDLSDSVLLATSGTLLDRGCLEANHGYFQAMVDCLKASVGKRIYVKFHPHESLKTQERTLRLFDEAQVNYSIIEQGTIMEMELLQSNNVVVYGFDSSLQYYAVMLGHKSFSLSNYLYGNEIIKMTGYRDMIPFFNQNK